MLIIVEGCDLSGKSTFIEQFLIPQLERDDPYALISTLNKGPAMQSAMDEYVVPLLQYRPGRQHHIICGRWHWGEMVYPSIVGRVSHMSDAEFRQTEEFLTTRGAFIVYITSEVNVLEARYDIRGDRYIKREWLAPINEAFDRVAAISRLPFVRVNTSYPLNMGSFAEHVIRLAVDWERYSLS